MITIRLALGVLALACASACNAVAPIEATQTTAPPKAIPDQEPEVTAQVTELLKQYASDGISADRLTTKASTALAQPEAQSRQAALRNWGTLSSLELLERKTFGEDRIYRYRARFGTRAALLDISFNKGGRVDTLVIKPE